MKYNNLIKKIKNKLWSILLKKCKYKNLHFKLYKSYWNLLFNSRIKNNDSRQNYYSAIPNKGAGIGHQMANWIAGYWYAKQFDLKFAHSPFSTEEWEKFLGLGENENSVDYLINTKGYKKVRLPIFDEFKLDEISLVKKIIKSYGNQKIVFIAEQDQGYRDQFGVQNDIKLKFCTAASRKKDVIIYDKSKYNIAIHIRRGDITVGQKNKHYSFLKRWQDNSYFENVLDNALQHLKTDKEIAIYVFSQGNIDDFKNFEKHENIIFCLDMSAQQSFLHMVNADLLITSKSSFSFKPALLSNGIKICPKDFWHGYPKQSDWILAEEDGKINTNLIIK